MKTVLTALRLQDIFFRLPVFLAAVCIAPNFNEARLLGVFVITHVLVYPASAFIRFVSASSPTMGLSVAENRGKWYLSALVVPLLVPVLAYRTGLWFSVGVLAYLLFLFSEKLLNKPAAVPVHRATADGLIILAVAFCGLNDYDPSHIWQLKVAVMGLLSSLWMWFRYRLEQPADGLRRTAVWLFLRLIAAVIAVLMLAPDVSRIVPFAAAMALPALVLIFWNVRPETSSRFYPRFLTVLTAAGLVAFLMWYFLDVTNVLQVFG